MFKEKKLSKQETLTVMVKLNAEELKKVKVVQEEIGGGKAKAIKYFINK